MTNIIEDGIQYEIEDGKVVQASATDAPTDTLEIKAGDRISHGSKLGSVVGIIPSVYGQTAVVKFDDGSLDELLLDHLKISDQRIASVEGETLQEQYAAYLEMPADTPDEIREKEHTARELNLRAKAAVTNSQLPLSDQIEYDRIVTATAVDILDLSEAEQYAKAAQENYLESQPRYRLPEEVSNSFGMNRGGDASWLFDAANEMPEALHDDEELVNKATVAVAQFSRSQLEDDDLMDLALVYAKEELADADKNERFASFFREARTQRLADEDGFQKNASVESLKDLDGNSFTLEDVPMESLYGV